MQEENEFKINGKTYAFAKNRKRTPRSPKYALVRKLNKILSDKGVHPNWIAGMARAKRIKEMLKEKESRET